MLQVILHVFVLNLNNAVLAIGGFLKCEVPYLAVRTTSNIVYRLVD